MICVFAEPKGVARQTECVETSGGSGIRFFCGGGIGMHAGCGRARCVETQDFASVPWRQQKTDTAYDAVTSKGP